MWAALLHAAILNGVYPYSLRCALTCANVNRRSCMLRHNCDTLDAPEDKQSGRPAEASPR